MKCYTVSEPQRYSSKGGSTATPVKGLIQLMSTFLASGPYLDLFSLIYSQYHHEHISADDARFKLKPHHQLRLVPMTILACSSSKGAHENPHMPG